MRAPPFWDDTAPRSSAALTRALLSPLGALYAWAGARRIRTTTPAPAPAPVICVGNLTVGGVGKTPVTAALMRAARQKGLKAAGLSRGWGGKLAGPVKVDAKLHSVWDVGDEPLLLSRLAPVYVARHRPEGAMMAAQEGADLILMDDGHQNPSLEKTLSIVVVDAVTGWGPGAIFPAGPLREPVRAGLARADAVIVMCPSAEYTPDLEKLQLSELEIPMLTAWLAPEAAPPSGPLLAFAGIGRPQKFYDALEAAGGTLADTASFPDHHAFTRGEIEELADLAESHNATLITTEKDHVRLPGGVKGSVIAWPVRAVFKDEARLDALIDQAMDSYANSR